MTYDGELGVYTYTFENVPAANYQFKIAINGSWDENYGMGGARDGANYTVTVPETMGVTFYLDPVTGIFYCDASNIPVDDDSITFDSQDETYKAPFGAVAENEEVTFAIATGEDVTSAVLVIKGLGSYPMTKSDSLWDVTIPIPYKGEYDYYFVLSNGSNVAVYGDDDGYYGTGCVTDLTSVMPYDLVVYPEEAFYAMMNLVGSHDTTRILSYLDGIGDDRNQKDFASAFPTYEGTCQLAKERQHLVAFLQFTYAGAPTIYYGDEIGMVGSDDPDDRRAFEWGKGNRELVEYYARLAAVRAAYPALRTGSVESVDTGNASLMAYERDDILVIANNATSAKSYAVEGEYVDLVTGEAYNGSVPALRGVILVPAEKVVEINVNTADLAPAYDPAYIVGAEQPEEPEVLASGWSGYTTWVLTEDGTITFSPLRREDGKW